MGRGRNWAAERQREQMRSRGTDRASDLPGMMAPLPPPKKQQAPQPSKEDLRAQAAAAVTAWIEKKASRRRDAKRLAL